MIKATKIYKPWGYIDTKTGREIITSNRLKPLEIA